jgi:hypothetical protein
MTLDFNVLEKRAKELIAVGRIRDAIRIFLFMADGDPSLDGGYLGKRLGKPPNIGTEGLSRKTRKFG